MTHSLPEWSVVHRSLLAMVMVVSLGCVTSQAAFPSPSRAQASRGASRLSDDEVAEAERRLVELGYWTRSSDGTVQQANLRHALIAFQKINGRPRTGRLTAEELQALRAAQRLTPRENGYPHIEIDLVRQVLFIVDGEVGLTKILPVSSGNGKLFTEGGRTRRAITPVGRFTVLRKIKGWRRSPLGLLYYPLYIVGGIAIHGNPSVPAWPASHGCIRIPMFAAKEFSAMTPLGTVVLVYDAGESSQEKTTVL